MRLLSSLRSRIFLTSALVAVLSMGAAIYVVSLRVSRDAETALQREILATGALVENLRTTRTQTDAVMARLVADLPKLRAAVSTNDPPTVEGVAAEYQKQLKSNLLLVTNKAGGVLATGGTPPRMAAIIASQPAVREALKRHEGVSLLPQPNGVLQVVTVPIEQASLGLSRPEMLGTLSVGFLLDDGLAAQLKAITGCDIAFGMDGQVLSSTIPRSHYADLAGLLRSSGVSHINLAGEQYIALPRPLSPDAEPGPLQSGPVALILRSQAEQVRFLQTIHRDLEVTALVAVALATVLSFAVARTITRPLAAITDVMREVAATGDLTRKIALGPGRRLDDEDTRLLATTFNTLTDSIARFQREIGHRERLSSLGRLSTVIAHEVRNPLMIIKASLHALRQPDLQPAAMREALVDIDGEVVRLNRIVNEVLDFSRPIKFELAPTDVNALCRESAAAAQTAGSGPPVGLDLDPSVPALTTDHERLRQALVNMLVNARHAVDGRPAGHDPLVTLATRSDGARATIVVADRGVGIASVDLPRVFDPYFTTKRGGTGLGLAIAKNIIEGLGGTLGVTSTVGAGTELRIELPLDSPQTI